MAATKIAVYSIPGRNPWDVSYQHHTDPDRSQEHHRWRPPQLSYVPEIQAITLLCQRAIGAGVLRCNHCCNYLLRRLHIRMGQDQALDALGRPRLLHLECSSDVLGMGRGEGESLRWRSWSPISGTKVGMKHQPGAQLVASLIHIAAINCLKRCEAHSYLQHHGRILQHWRGREKARALFTLHSMVWRQRFLCCETLPALACVKDPTHRPGRPQEQGWRRKGSGD